MRSLRRYLSNLSTGRLVLWCYFIWYLVVLVRYFDRDPRIWLTSVGLSLIIGAALLINTTVSGKVRIKLEPWPTFRLFVTPFCVSSFSALVKGRGFFLIFSPRVGELVWGMALIVAFCVVVGICKRLARMDQAAHNALPSDGPP